ncbi:MAG: hypothetical protein ACFBQW_07755 [Sphingomonadaceae bacterium]
MSEALANRLKERLAFAAMKRQIPAPGRLMFKGPALRMTQLKELLVKKLVLSIAAVAALGLAGCGEPAEEEAVETETTTTDLDLTAEEAETDMEAVDDELGAELDEAGAEAGAAADAAGDELEAAGEDMEAELEGEQ